MTIHESRLTTVARRGLSLPAETREQIRKIGILCRPQVEIVYQQGASQGKLRARNQAGSRTAWPLCGFCRSQRRRIAVAAARQNFLPNGIHAVVIADELVRVEMFRYETTYHLLISKHWLQRKDGERPELKSAILFLGRNGSLDTELWDKDAAFRGGAMPHFYARSGELAPPDATWTNATLKITEAACCCGCRHSHLLEASMSSSSSPVSPEQAEEQHFEFENEGMPA